MNFERSVSIVRLGVGESRKLGVVILSIVSSAPIVQSLYSAPQRTPDVFKSFPLIEAARYKRLPWNSALKTFDIEPQFKIYKHFISVMLHLDKFY